ncbi:large ribosomal subunit protein uL14c-like [Gastrolobium bilobum]|uniref:large ribosomal subunit protein uL14c-like n=1 Tax=Gastrolobium bilobum TaxID=150636 RepID=UPI002AAF9DD7|nr:large ribosomal subunit protein uL14c-like [Gastrolobium bilobum]
MIQPQTRLNVADNSGARELMCIRIIGANNKRYASIGDIVVVVVKEAVPNTSLERSEVIEAVNVRTCKELKRSNGIIIHYDDNTAVVIDQKGNPKRTRIFCAITRELRHLNFVTVTDVRGQVISWSSAGTLGFKGTRRGTPFATQIAAGNAIRMVADQGMQQAEVMIKGPGL